MKLHTEWSRLYKLGSCNVQYTEWLETQLSEARSRELNLSEGLSLILRNPDRYNPDQFFNWVRHIAQTRLEKTQL